LKWQGALSLRPADEEEEVVKQITEIRWHGRAGQGTVSAAKMLAESALEGGLHAQAFPEYGPEREGAPLKAYNRVSREPFTLYCSINNPGVVVVVDPSLLKIGDFKDGAGEKAIYIINTPDDPARIRTLYGLDKAAVWTVDATGISLATLGKNIPNTVMLGALSRVTGLVPVDMVIACMLKEFGKKLSQDMIDRNVTAVRRAYEEVREG
jgi:pyruvate ferredoxin oxidoreductase gamma subunit